MSDKYILDENGNPVRCDELYTWGRWIENHSARRVSLERFGIVRKSEVSTVFLGLDHRFGDEGPPILWETMVFGGPLDQERDRCSGSREQALAMHAQMVKKVKESYGFKPTMQRIYNKLLKK